ncbi:MAG: NACHT domain-containing protein [Candidatus Aminicenantes bacterium]
MEELVDKRIDYSADYYEEKLRYALFDGLYSKGKDLLIKTIKEDPSRQQRLIEELGYIYNFYNLMEDDNHWVQRKDRIDWRRKVWLVLSNRNDFTLDFWERKNIEEKESYEEEEKKDSETIETSYNTKGNKPKTALHIVSELQTPVLELFEKFLTMCGEEFKIDILKKGNQASWFKLGYDFEFACRIEGERKSKLRIECKNYADEIKLADIASKLETAKLNFSNDPIDHWIVISPFAKIASDLNHCLNSWKKNPKYPFKVHVWNHEKGVDQLFGLVPEVYDIFYKSSEDYIHPKDWSKEKKQEVLELWKQKLEIPLMLPQDWEQYISNPDKLMLEPKEIEFKRLYDNNDYIELNCIDENGKKLLQKLEERVYNWLEEPIYKSRALFILGDFGDGKTFFTYVLSRKLLEKFISSPKDGWIPVRFALKNFKSGKVKNIQDFLQHRLNEIRADIAGWNELRSSGYKILAILDGFDEISKELDPETIQRNMDILINFYENDCFSDMKLLITSRKHFFENHKEKEWLIDKLDKPQLVHLAPIDRKIAEDYLKKYAAGIGKEEKFNKLKKFHDPIGLASKPLFLDMVQVSLENLPEKDLNEYTLYETYILESLKRKVDYLNDEEMEIPEEKIIKNLLKVLEQVALELHQYNQEFVYLSDIRGTTNLKQWLWVLSAPNERKGEDETARTAMRSLLKRIDVKNQPNNKKWPVDFCHRLMREYFAARAVCNLLEMDMKEAETFLARCFLNQEILFFASEIMKHRDFDYESTLLDLIRKTRNVEKIDRIKLGHLGGNAVNLLYQYKGKLPGYDWRNLVLDGAILPDADLSGKDFSGTSLQYANLDNINVTNSKFSNCNLTETIIYKTPSIQSIAISLHEKILVLYDDGIIREWNYHEFRGTTFTNLSGSITRKDMKLIALPGNDLTVLHDRFLYFYDRNNLNLDLKAAIEIKPNFRLIKATRNYLLLNEEDGKQNRLLLVDLNKEAIIKSFICEPFTLCDHLDDYALVIFNQAEELQLIDLTPGKRTPLVIPAGQKVACISTCKCGQLAGQYLIGLGLYNGTVQVWQSQVDQWKCEKILDQLLHEPGKPVKDICFIDECRIVSGGLDKTIKLLKFDPDGEQVGEPKEFKMTL